MIKRKQTYRRTKTGNKRMENIEKQKKNDEKEIRGGRKKKEKSGQSDDE